MADPKQATEAEIQLWEAQDGHPIQLVVIGGPEEGPDVTPCPALVSVSPDETLVRVAWQLDEIELAALAQGGTLWLTTWGGLPIHSIGVTYRAEDAR
jgi:hypothetical protein